MRLIGTIIITSRLRSPNVVQLYKAEIKTKNFSNKIGLKKSGENTEYPPL